MIPGAAHNGSATGGGRVGETRANIRTAKMTFVAGMRILVVTGDAARAADLRAALTAAGYAVIVRTDSLEGLIAVEKDSPALVVLDWAMPFIDGAIFVHALRAGLHHPPPVVAFAGPATDPAAVRGAGATAVLPAPPDSGDVVQAVRHVLDQL